MEDKTTSSSSSAYSTISSVTNECLSAFLVIIFSKMQYTRKGDISSLIHANITDHVRKILATCSSTSEQSRMVSNGIEVLTDDVTNKGRT